MEILTKPIVEVLVMRCKICKGKLDDISYYLDVHGAKVKKEELVCPNEDQHLSILEQRIEEYPTRCPICDLEVDSESEYEIYKDPRNNKLTISVDFSCICGFKWSIIGNAEVVIDEEQVNEYGEWD